MSQPNSEQKPSGYINVAATISPVFTCCLSAVTNRNIANRAHSNPPHHTRDRRFSFAQSEVTSGIEHEDVEISVDRD